MKKLIFALILVLSFSCSDDDCGCTIIETNLDVAIKDVDGNNLLNTEDYNFQNIQIKYSTPNSGSLINGESPILIEEGEVRMRIFLNSNSNDEFPTTYVIWNNNDIDTIRATFNRNGNNTIVNQIWYNETLVQDYIEPEYYINVIK